MNIPGHTQLAHLASQLSTMRHIVLFESKLDFKNRKRVTDMLYELFKIV